MGILNISNANKFKGLSNDEILTRDELKKIVGGFGSEYNGSITITPGREGCQKNHDFCMGKLPDPSSYEDPSAYIVDKVLLTRSCEADTRGCCQAAYDMGNPC